MSDESMQEARITPELLKARETISREIHSLLPWINYRDVELVVAGVFDTDAPPEVLAAAKGGTYRTGRIGRGMRRKHVIEWPVEEHEESAR